MEKAIGQSGGDFTRYIVGDRELIEPAAQRTRYIVGDRESVRYAVQTLANLRGEIANFATQSVEYRAAIAIAQVTLAYLALPETQDIRRTLSPQEQQVVSDSELSVWWRLVRGTLVGAGVVALTLPNLSHAAADPIRNTGDNTSQTTTAAIDATIKKLKGTLTLDDNSAEDASTYRKIAELEKQKKQLQQPSATPSPQAPVDNPSEPPTGNTTDTSTLPTTQTDTSETVSTASDTDIAALLGQVNNTDGSHQANRPGGSSLEPTNLDTSRVVTIDPSVNSNTPPTSSPADNPAPEATTDQPTWQTPDEAAKAIEAAAQRMRTAINSGDEGKVKEAFKDNDDIGDVGTLLAQVEAWNGINTVSNPDVSENERSSEVTPAPEIMKGTLDKIKKLGGNKESQNALTMLLNSSIELSRHSPVPRNSPVTPDRDQVKAQKKLGYDTTAKGFGAAIYDCKQVMEALFKHSGVDTHFGGGSATSRGNMNTGMLRNELVKTGRATGSVQYTIRPLSSMKTKDIPPGSVVVGSGHILLLLDGDENGGVKGDDGKLYQIADAARGSMRVFSLRPLSDLGYMRNSIKDAIVATVKIPSSVESKHSQKAKVMNTEGYAPILTVIGGAESNNNYNAYFGNAGNSKTKFTGMTIAEVLAWQDKYVAEGSPSSAVGYYQFIRGTLRRLVKDLNLSMSQKFDEATQDKLAIALLEGRGATKYAQGKISANTFAANLAKEWASLPKITGKNPSASYYAGDGLNAAHVKISEIMGAIKASGPDTR